MRRCSGTLEFLSASEVWAINQTGLLSAERSAQGGASLAGPLAKSADLGNLQALSVDTALGLVFVLSPDVATRWQPGQAVSLTLAGRGVSVVAA